MTSILESMGYIQQQGEAGKKKGLMSLLGTAYGAPADQRQQILSTVAQRGGADLAFNAESHFSNMDDQARQRLGQYAAAFSALPPEQKAAAYPQLAEMGRSVGLPVPQGDYQPAYDAGIAQIGQAFGGAAAGGNVQSTYVDDQGNRVAVMRDGSRQVLGRNAPNNQIIDTGNGFYGVNKGNLQAAPVMMGGQQPYTIDPSLPPEVQAAIRANPDAGNPQGIQSLQVGEQLRKAPPQLTPYQQAQLELGRERLSTSQAASARAAEAAAAAQSLKNQAAEDKRNKVKAAQADTISTYDDSIKRIDDLLRSPDVGTLGTYMGDAQALLPHTGARNARAALDTIRNRVLLDTISKLKALSATGASGFGALSNQEGEILKNSIASLDKAQTHDAIVAALKDIQRVMRDSRARVAGVGGETAPKPAAGGWKVEVVN